MERTIITRRASRSTSAGCVSDDLIPQPRRLHVHSHVFLPPPPADKTSRHRSHSDTCWNLGHHVLELLDAQKLISTFSSLSGFHGNKMWDDFFFFFIPGCHCSFFPSFLVKYLLRPEAVWAVIYLFVSGAPCTLWSTDFCVLAVVSLIMSPQDNTCEESFYHTPAPTSSASNLPVHWKMWLCSPCQPPATHTAPPPAEPLTRQTAFCIEDQV